jgi:hypothetical protein
MKMKTGKLTDDKESAAAQDDLGQLQRLTEKSGELSESFIKTTATGTRLATAMAELAGSLEKNKQIFDAYAGVVKGIENTQLKTPQEGFMDNAMEKYYKNKDSKFSFFGNSDGENQ